MFHNHDARSGVVVPPEGDGGSGVSRPAVALDQKRENRKTETGTGREWLESVPEGGYVAIAQRSGGAHDPLGVRSCDVMRADDVVEIIRGHPGRVLFVTLTIDRHRMLWDDQENGPEVAYQVANERVRKVAAMLSTRGIHITALELQGKTGEGWPHWHIAICAEGPTWEEMGSTDEERERAWEPERESILKAVRRAWVFTDEEVDHDTGEVIRHRGEPIAGRQGVDVQIARTIEGISVYLAKYVVKPWHALPRWMLRSNRQLRKLRLSPACFEWLQRRGRHTIKHGARRVARSTRRRARPLIDRRATSGASHGIFQRQGQKLRFVRTVPAPADGAGIAMLIRAGGVVVQAGVWRKCRTMLSVEALQHLDQRRNELRALQAAYIDHRRREDWSAWYRMQWEAENAAHEREKAQVYRDELRS